MFCLRPYSTSNAHLLFFTSLEYEVSDKRKVAEAPVTWDFLAHWLRTELTHLATVLCWQLTSHWLSISSVGLFNTTAPKLSHPLTNHPALSLQARLQTDHAENLIINSFLKTSSVLGTISQSIPEQPLWHWHAERKLLHLSLEQYSICSGMMAGERTVTCPTTSPCWQTSTLSRRVLDTQVQRRRRTCLGFSSHYGTTSHQYPDYSIV